jgi:LCP family protein required for cell wall assembly
MSFNILDNLPEEFKEKEKSKSRVIKFFLGLLFFAVLGYFFLLGGHLSGQGDGQSWLAKIPFIIQASHLVESATQKLKGEDNNRINILLLGIGGKGHDGAYLTDTIMLTSVQPSTKNVAMVSIPRDLIVPIEGMGWRKVNNIDAYAESQTPGSGGLAASQAIGDLLNVPVDYYLRIDFDGFKKVIDDLGGIQVDVENTLDDYTYPVLGMEEAEPYSSRYEHLHIEKGIQQMDGELALKYARSRHAAGVEGSDFARSRRQQKVIQAIKDKMASVNFILNPSKISNVYNDLADHISINLKIWEIFRLWTMLKDVKEENITNKVLDNSPSGLLVDARGLDGAYILTPKSGDFSEVQYLVQNVFNNNTPLAKKDEVKIAGANLEVLNGTWVDGLASRIAMDLEKQGFVITRVANALNHNFQKSVIYDLTNGAKNDALTVLKDKTNANTADTLPAWLTNDLQINSVNRKQPDFILIIGEDADKTKSGAMNNE